MRLAQKPSLFSDFDGFYRFFPFYGHFWPFLVIFGPPSALGFLKHLHEEPGVYIYPFAMAPAKKTPIILNSFHFHLFFFDVVVRG